MIHTNEGNRMVMKKPEEERHFNIGLYGVQVTETDKFVCYKPNYNYIKDEMEVVSGLSKEQLHELWKQAVMPPIPSLDNLPIWVGTPGPFENDFVEMNKLFYKPIDDTSNNK